MIKHTFIFVVVAMLTTTLVKASLSEKELPTYRDAVLRNGARAVLKNYAGTGYAFEIATRSRTVEILFLFSEDVMKQPEGDVFVRMIEAAARPDAPSSVGWSKVTAAESARFFYVLDHSEVLNLAQRNSEDPFKTVVLGQSTTYKCVSRKQGRETIVERQRGDSLPTDYLFDFLIGTFVQRLETQ